VALCEGGRRKEGRLVRLGLALDVLPPSIKKRSGDPLGEGKKEKRFGSPTREGGAIIHHQKLRQKGKALAAEALLLIKGGRGNLSETSTEKKGKKGNDPSV